MATVNSGGLAMAVGDGTATITATSGSISGNTALRVTFAGTISLAWIAPTTNTDGSPLTNLAGYITYYKPASGSYIDSVDVGNVTTYTLTGLAQGQTYYIITTAYNTSKTQSVYSNSVSGVPQ